MFSFRFLGLFVFAFLGVQCIEKEGLHWLHMLPFYRLIPKSISLIFQHKIQHTILHDDDKVKKMFAKGGMAWEYGYLLWNKTKLGSSLVTGGALQDFLTVFLSYCYFLKMFCF